MALTIRQRFIVSVRKYLPWLPARAVAPTAAALVLVPAITVLGFSYGPMASVQPESGSLSGGASVVADASASGGQSLKFGAAGGGGSALICNLNATTANFASQISAATTGQTVCLAAGNYGTFNGTNKAITIGAQEGVIATMGVNLGVNDRDFTIDNVTIPGGNISGNSSSYGGSDRPQNITIRNSDFTAALNIEYIDNANILLDSNTHIDIDNNASCTMTPARLHFSYASNNHSGVTVSNSYLAGGNTDGIQTGTPLNIINNEFYNIKEKSIDDCAHTDPIQLYGGHSMTIRGNYIHDVADGIVAYDGTSNNLIENNVLDIKSGRYGIELFSDTNSVVRHNTLVYGTGCAYVACGQIILSRKTADPPGTGTVIESNIASGISVDSGSTAATNRNNMLRTGASGSNFTGTPSYAGGLSPNNFAGFYLNTGSLGVNGAFNGTNVGIYPRS